MIAITLKDEGVQRSLDRVGALLDDLTPVMNRIGEQLAESAMQRIDREVSPDGTPFAPRSPATLARYKRQGRGFGGILHRSGDMRSDIFHAYGRDFAEVGSNAVQSAVMQFGQPKGASGTNARGRPIPWGDIPARPFLGISDDDRDAIGEIVGEWIGRAMTAP